MPSLKLPNNPNFSSGPCAKRPGWDGKFIHKALLGKSHRNTQSVLRIQAVIENIKSLLNIPNEYEVAIVGGSDTGAFEKGLADTLQKRLEDLKNLDINMDEKDQDALNDHYLTLKMWRSLADPSNARKRSRIVRVMDMDTEEQEATTLWLSWLQTHPGEDSMFEFMRRNDMDEENLTTDQLSGLLQYQNSTIAMLTENLANAFGSIKGYQKSKQVRDIRLGLYE